MKSHVTLMTEGKPVRLIVTFAFPLMIGNIFQQLYNVVDAAVVGRFVGLKALAAVGAGAFGNGLIISIVLGISSGASVVYFAKFEQDGEEVEE